MSDIATDSLATDKPVLVTGAGGWLASHTVYQLLEKGYRVRGTVRSLNGGKYSFLRDFHPKASTHLQLFEADLLKPEGWEAAVEGCDIVLHLASPFTFNYRDEEKELVRPAVDGVRNVFSACFKKGVKRIVQTSSVCSVTYGHPAARYKCNRRAVEAARKAKLASLSQEASSQETVTSEAEINHSARTSSPTGTHFADFKLFDESDFSVVPKIIGYELSKTKAELEAWSLVTAHNETNRSNPVELVALCPGFIFGPMFCADHSKGESAAQIQRVILKTYPYVPDVSSGHVDVRDAAKCHILAMEAPSEKVSGQRFILCADDGNLTFVEQAQIIAKHFKKYGFSPAVTASPHWLTKLGGYILPSVKAAATKLDWISYVSNNKAHNQLGMTQWRRTEDALISHCLSLMKYGIIERRRTPDEVIEANEPYAKE